MLHWSVKPINCITKSLVTILMNRPVQNTGENQATPPDGFFV